MRVLRWSGVGALGLLLGVGCSASDDVVPGEPGPDANASFAGAAGDAGTAGTTGVGEVAGGGRPSGSGRAAILGDAGASGACAGNYACPLVGWDSSATITVDLPVSVADAEAAMFTACRDSDCQSALGNVGLTSHWGWAQSKENDPIFLTFDDSGATPSARLYWEFLPDRLPASDHYSLTIQPVGAASAVTLFDAQVGYTTVVDDPTLVGEGYCRHCSEVSVAVVDARANQ